MTLDQSTNLSVEHEDIYMHNDKDIGCLFIVAVHNTKNGPALGGCRYVQYDSVDSALKDAMRLSRAMTYKSAMAGLPLGGGKAVILQHSQQADRKLIFQSFGNFINTLNGQYITASDSGTNEEDMKIIAQSTPFVTSIGSAASKTDNTAEMTALGVLNGIKAATHYRMAKSSLKDMVILIQGVGSVGSILARNLSALGAKLILTDKNHNLAKKVAHEVGAKVVDVQYATQTECDIFSPCALGGVLNQDSINKLNCKIICGAANNQLAAEEDDYALFNRDILYIPDYAVNSGGVICAAAQYGVMPKSEISPKMNNIYNSVLKICEISKQQRLPTYRVANELIEASLF